MSGAIIGVDPGASGAVGVVTSRGKLVLVTDIESVEKGVASPELFATILRDARNVGALAEEEATGSLVGELEHLYIAATVVERVGAMPKQGVSSTFKFGTSNGIVLGAAAMLGAPILNPTPTTWKRDMKLSRDKNASRAMAVRLWPEWGHAFKRVMDADRAEAALLAEWGRRHLAGLLVKPEHKYLHLPA